MHYSKKRSIFAFVIELDRHIEILLLSHDCVIVPDLGGFLTHHIEASYDDGDKLFLPPLRTIGFNPQLKINDSLLVQSYVEAYDISYPEALSRIENEVTKLKEELDKNHQFELNDIGTLFLNDEGNYEFRPCEAGILIPELYGLSSFVMQPLNHEDSCDNVHNLFDINVKTTEVDNNAHTVKAIDDNEQKEAVAEVDKIGVTEDKDSEEDYTSEGAIHISFSTMRNFATAAIAIVAFLLLSEPIGNTDKDNFTKSNIDTNILYSMLPKNVTKGEIKASDIHNNKVERRTKIENKDNKINKIVKAENEIDNYYCIVLASKVKLKNAEYFVNHLHKKGYNDAKIYIKGHCRKVIYGQYNTEALAYKKLNDLHDNKDFKDGWIMHVRK